MPFELGMDFGCQRYGGFPFSDKVILILDEERFRLQKALSDLAGSDIIAHEGDSQKAVRKVRNWLATTVGEVLTISATRILAEYEEFQTWHYERQLVNGFSEQDIQDYPTTELLDEMLVWHKLHESGR